MTGPSPCQVGQGGPPCARYTTRRSVDSRRVGHGQAGCLESLEDKAHGHRALPDGCRDAFDRTTADIADAEDARSAGFENERRISALSRRLAGMSAPVSKNPCPSSASCPASHPVHGIGPDEDKQPADPERRGLLVGVVAQIDPLEIPLADEAGDFGPWRHPNVGDGARSGRSGSATSSLRAIRPRMTMRTSGHVRARYSAACPAELPPPTMTTGPPEHAFASICVAA